MFAAHHAYYIEDSPTLFGAYRQHLKPFWANRFERFGIDEARALIALASLKNLSETTFLIAAASLTTEAQQALLKLFEEPQRGTVFVLLAPHGALLPTLRSRMLPYEKSQISNLKSQAATKFLKLSPKERSAEVAKILKDDEGVRERVREFINALEQELYRHFKKQPTLRRALEDVAKVRSYLGDRSPSLKMLLEYMATSLPRL